MDVIENKVQISGIITIDIEEYLDNQPIVTLDLKSWLFMDVVLKEKEFRIRIKEHDWSQYRGKSLLITYPEEALIPSWAYMLLIVAAKSQTDLISFGTYMDLERERISYALSKINFTDFQDQKVVIKGCSNITDRTYYYAEITKRLLPFAYSIMYGEPCSTVPVFKRKPK